MFKRKINVAVSFRINEPSFKREKKKELNAENESDKFLAFISDVYRSIDR